MAMVEMSISDDRAAGAKSLSEVGDESTWVGDGSTWIWNVGGSIG